MRNEARNPMTSVTPTASAVASRICRLTSVTAEVDVLQRGGDEDDGHDPDRDAVDVAHDRHGRRGEGGVTHVDAVPATTRSSVMASSTIG